MSTLRVSMLAFALAACAEHVGQTLPSAAPQAPTPESPRGAWLENSAEEAFREAQAQRRLLLADLWAPWCHTCLSMRAQVLDEARVPELANVVRLAIDTERTENERFLQRYPAVVWPTFYLIDPETRQVRGRWLGGASPKQLSQWLLEASNSPTATEALLRQADDFSSQQQLSQAEASYRAALAEADPAQRSRALVALISTLLKQAKFAECLQLALHEVAQLPASVSAVDFAATALSCADKAADPALARSTRSTVEAVLSRDCSTRAPGVSADDQADACDNLRSVRAALGDTEGARRAAEQELSVIDAASAGASAEVQAIYDWHRSAALVFLGRSEEAIQLLKERERALPQRYNAAHYLARIYRDQKRWSEGLLAIDRALAKAYGPRRVALLGVKASLLEGADRVHDARCVLTQQLAEYRALPAGQKRADAEAAVQERLQALSPPTEPCASP